MALKRMLAAIAVLAGLAIGGAVAQPAPPSPKPEMMENCPGLIANRVPRAIPAAFSLAALAGDVMPILSAGGLTGSVAGALLVFRRQAETNTVSVEFLREAVRLAESASGGHIQGSPPAR